MKSKLLLTCTILFFCSSFLCGQNQSSKVANSVETNIGCIRHPWQGKRVGYLGDSITDPNCYGDKIKKYWDFLQEWLGITPYVYGISGRQWNDVPRQAEQLKKEHGGEVDAIVILMGTNDFTLICNYFKALKRQGPGSPEITQKAVSFINELSDKARIADIGCGTGGQTMALANYTKGHITGIDLFPDFIEIFNRNAIEAHCEDRVKGIVGSMDALPFLEEELDLIWSEGAIYNIGFERGMNEWNKFLKKNGLIAVTEASWFTPERPSEIDDFWMANAIVCPPVPQPISAILASSDSSLVKLRAFCVTSGLPGP